MKTAKLIISAAFAVLAFPVTNARAFFECFEPPRGQPPAPAAQRVDCESATGHTASSVVDQGRNVLIVTLADANGTALGNGRASSIGYDANGDATASRTLIEPGTEEDEGRDTIVAHDIQLITDEV